jgi:hypothetical protein
MRVLGVALFLGSSIQGILAQQEFLERLPSCAVRLRVRRCYQSVLTSCLVKMRCCNPTKVSLPYQRFQLPLCRHDLHDRSGSLQLGELHGSRGFASNKPDLCRVRHPHTRPECYAHGSRSVHREPGIVDGHNADNRSSDLCACTAWLG